MSSAARILGTRLWLRLVLAMLGITKASKLVDELDKPYSQLNFAYGIDRRGPESWEKGKAAVWTRTAHRVESRVPNTEYVLGIYRLLSPGALSAPAALRAVQGLYRQQIDGEKSWALPPPGFFRPPSVEVVFYAWEDSASLARRGDLLGFLAILALLRTAVARSEFQRSAELAIHMYTALPSVCRLAWVRPDIDLLLQCIEDMMGVGGIRWFFTRILIDWEAFRAEVLMPTAWQGTPPWILSRDVAEGRPASPRPVPLLEDVVPLHHWVRRPAEPGHEKVRRGKRRLPFFFPKADS
ncbi:hypothetical protein [Dyella sp. AtDHG13]|uniref:hypothetical protein n=1 Tax=Dyella sp. AtDHG13 TaxID=1938897 RepID=UPI0011B384A9|nr:hypothetical protein [Dyella sp. AtDHG13]